MPKRIYFDSASTTAIHPEVLKTYEALLAGTYVNSESLYTEGVKINQDMEKARSAIAGLLGVTKDEVLFTGGSSESNNLAIKGVCFANLSKKHIITTRIEHSSILNCCKQMERVFGYEVTYLPVDSYGLVKVSDVKADLRPDTVLVSVMGVNNEVGSVQPVEEIAELVKKESSAYFHTDLTQAVGKVTFSLQNVDLASISAHKLEGLKGSGILVKKTYVPIEPLINGGEQEFGLRGGTSNAVSNMVFAKTLRLALENQAAHDQEIRDLRTRLLEGLKSIDGVLINSPIEGIPSVVNFSYEGLPSEVMQNALNEKGFMISARSTCESKSHNPSYVLKAMGYSDLRAGSCIRLSLSYHNTREEIDAFLEALKEIIHTYGNRI